MENVTLPEKASPSKNNDPAPPTNPALFSDKPISSEAEDRIDFGPFADALARSLSEMIPPEGLVISVEGEWGSGKTSALQLALKKVMAREIAQLENRPLEEVEEQPLSEIEGEWEKLAIERNINIVRFNPWLFAGQENSVRAFFVELGAEIGHGNASFVKSALDAVKERLPAIGGVVGPGAGAFVMGLAGAAAGASAGAAGGRAAGEVLAS